MKKTLVRLILLLLLTIILSNSMIVSALSPVSLKLWHVWTLCEVFPKVLDDFSKAYPNIKLEIDGTTFGYDIKIKTAIAANEAPDIFFSWGGGFSAPFVRAGKVLPLSDYLNDGARNKLLKGSLVNFSYDGKVYALPTSLAIGVLYCNQELFDKYGIKIPETYQELVNAIKAFNSKGILPLAIGQKDPWTGMFWYDALALRTAGAKLCREALTKKVSFEQPEFTAAAAKLVELVDLNAFGEHAFNRNWVETNELFSKGKAAMLFHGTWVSAELEKEGSVVKGKIVARKFPLVEGGRGTATEYFGGACDSFMVSANTRHKKEAVQAVKFICEEMAKQLYLSGLGLPLWKINVGDTSKINPLIIEQARMIQDATAYVAWWDVFLQGDDANIHKSLVRKLFNSTITPEQYSQEMRKVNEKR